MQIEYINTKDITIFPNMTLAAARFNTTTATIGSYIKSQKVYKDRYLFTTVTNK